jgi:hypothetical protein
LRDEIERKILIKKITKDKKTKRMKIKFNKKNMRMKFEKK